ncbi:MAG: beta-glucuronidase [Rhodothermales bacterium]|nr:beta-glucuronidase [Rhodothermales bacterium]
MSRYSLLLLLSALSLPVVAQQVQITNVDARSAISLDGDWSSIIDPYENGYYNYRYEPHANGYFRNQKPQSPSDLVEYDFDTSPVLAVPGDWNSQRPELLLYEGTIWYKRSFGYDLPAKRRAFLHFGGANYEARVYLNGNELGVHSGGFTPFAYEVTDRLRGESNDLVVKVDNRRRRDGVPTVNTDWWNYGGLTRKVRVIEVPDTFIRDYVVQLAPAQPDRVTGWVQLDGPDAKQTVTVRIPTADVEHEVQTDADGYASFSFSADLRRWSPDDPHLYEVVVESRTDRVIDQIGFRTVTTRGSQVLLNGEPIFMRGISIHEEAPLRGGRAHHVEDARTLLGWARELGCNFVRLAHYPHNETMVREADRMGLLVWSEIPVYWTILWDNPETFALAMRQLEEMIARDRNRASVVIWSVANETPRTPSRLTFLNRLIDRARELDGTRLISAATELSYDADRVIVDDPLAASLDVIGANEYVGWYSRRVEDIGQLKWESEFEKPLIMSEFGGGAKYGLHGDAGTRWTEEYQAELYRQQVGMLERIPFLAGMSPWILMDFRSPRRPLPGVQDFWNRKGLLSERGDRKLAFYVLQGFYRDLQVRDHLRR